MAKKITLRAIEGKSAGYYTLMAVLGALIALGLGAAHYMEENGHYVTGMTNQIVWGMPHIFAVFLIVAASGALNVASISSVFNKTAYKPLAPLSGLLAVSLLIGGLTILVLDLGRPDRLIVAMTYYNFKSIFAWNIFLYTGFIAIVAVYLWMMLEKRFNKYSSQVGFVAFVWRLILTITIVYLWMMMERKMNKYYKPAGFVAFVWRLILTTGTGSIFGFLVAREFYNAAIMAPMFILMSFSFGLAIFILVVTVAFKGTQRPLGDLLVERLRKLLGVFIASVLFFVAIFHLTNLYITQRHGIEQFILAGDNVYTTLFWVGFVVVGSAIPLLLTLLPNFKKSLSAAVSASILVIAGGLSLVYVIIIGGQAYPLEIFPGKEVSSSFFDGVVNQYSPSFPEIALGLGGTALALFIVSFAVKILSVLPDTLANAEIDPHYKGSEASGEEPAAAQEASA